MIFNQDFREFIESLYTNEVQYLVAGGYAVAFHEHPRYTKDIDIWLKVEPENAKKVIQALADFGFATLDAYPSNNATISQMGRRQIPAARTD